MEKTTRLLLSLMLISGSLLSACAPDVEVIVEEDEEEMPEDTAVEEKAEDEEGPEEVEEAPAEEATGPKVREPQEEPADEPSTDDAAPLTMYLDGTYSGDGSYISPAGAEGLTVTLTVENDVVTAVSISKAAGNDTSANYQSAFENGIASSVVGVPLDELNNVSVVNGASLTTGGFNSALADIKAAAAR